MSLRQAAGHSETYRRIANVQLSWPSQITPDAKDLYAHAHPHHLCAHKPVTHTCAYMCACTSRISKLLVKDPKKRLPLEEVLKHPWIVRHDVTEPTA